MLWGSYNLLPLPRWKRKYSPTWRALIRITSFSQKRY